MTCYLVYRVTLNIQVTTSLRSCTIFKSQQQDATKSFCVSIRIYLCFWWKMISLEIPHKLVKIQPSWDTFSNSPSLTYLLLIADQCTPADQILAPEHKLFQMVWIFYISQVFHGKTRFLGFLASPDSLM